MRLHEANQNQKLFVESIDSEGESDREARLMQLGFLPGTEIMISHRAPLFSEPLLVEVRSRLIALTKEEAHLVKVKLC